MSSENQGGSVPFRIVADRSRCCGYGLCAALCPEVYKLDAEGLVYIEGDLIAVEFQAGAREGVAACPAEALTIETVSV